MASRSTGDFASFIGGFHFVKSMSHLHPFCKKPPDGAVFAFVTAINTGVLFNKWILQGFQPDIIKNNGTQSIDVAIDFDGINVAGNDLAACAASANLKLADASVKFGTWVGTIEYNIELVENSVGGGENPGGGTHSGGV